jgi:serine/threonine protein kinase
VIGVCDAAGAKAVVTEYVKGANLAAPLKAGQKFTLAQAQGIGRAIAQTLAALHARGVAHGSVQPSNVMSAGGVMKLADLGLGRLHRALVPTSPYTAPEGRVDAAGDVFALGALLHHLVTGAPPRSQEQQAANQIDDDDDRLGRHAPCRSAQGAKIFRPSTGFPGRASSSRTPGSAPGRPSAVP